MKRPKVLVSDLRWRTNDWRKDNFWRANYPPKINMSLKKGPFYRGNFIDSTPQFSGDVWYMGMLVFSLGYIKLQGITKTKQQQINLCHYLVLNLVCLGIHLFPPSAGVLSTHWHKNSPLILKSRSCFATLQRVLWKSSCQSDWESNTDWTFRSRRTISFLLENPHKSPYLRKTSYCVPPLFKKQIEDKQYTLIEDLV